MKTPSIGRRHRMRNLAKYGDEMFPFHALLQKKNPHISGTAKILINLMIPINEDLLCRTGILGKYVFWSILSISRDQSDVPYQSKYKPTIGTEPSNLNVMLC